MIAPGNMGQETQGSANRGDVFYEGSVAVITGAASGIGRATARHFAKLGMKVCLADVQDDKLKEAREEVASLSKNGAKDVHSVIIDVTRAADVERLASEAYEKFNAVHVLMNNAADFNIAFPLDGDHWRSVMETNFFGVLYGVQTFVPRMLHGGQPGLILNLGSKLGITNPPLNPAYNASKAAVKNLTESLEHQLRSQPGSKLSAALLIPGWTTTGIHKPQPGAWMPDQVVDFMMGPLRRGDFYIVCPDNEVSPAMDRARFLWAIGDVVENRPALSRWHPDFQDQYREEAD
jgi:NAD(P)-dependent dehydrogenase (short-subunit alcohol dehydrogenase family)